MDAQRWQRVSAIFYEVAEAAPSARATLLEKLCGPDDELRSEVLTMLAADAVDVDFEHGVGSAS